MYGMKDVKMEKIGGDPIEKQRYKSFLKWFEYRKDSLKAYDMEPLNNKLVSFKDAHTHTHISYLIRNNNISSCQGHGYGLFYLNIMILEKEGTKSYLYQL